MVESVIRRDRPRFIYNLKIYIDGGDTHQAVIFIEYGTLVPCPLESQKVNLANVFLCELIIIFSLRPIRGNKTKTIPFTMMCGITRRGITSNWKGTSKPGMFKGMMMIDAQVFHTATTPIPSRRQQTT